MIASSETISTPILAVARAASTISAERDDARDGEPTIAAVVISFLHWIHCYFLFYVNICFAMAGNFARISFFFDIVTVR